MTAVNKHSWRALGQVADESITEEKLAPDDEAASTFFIGPVTHDFGGAATAVATKITDAAPCKLEVLAVYCTVIEAKAGGSGNDATIIAKEAAGTTASTGTITCTMADTVYSNKIGSVVGAVGVGTANAQYAEGADIYAYTDAQTSRSAGKYAVTLHCKKIA